MSVRPSSQKNTCHSSKSGLFRSEQVRSPSDRELSSDDSDYESLAFHRPKCPWGRRRSYIQKVKKNTLFDSSITCFPGNGQSLSKKPWMNTNMSIKNTDTWQRPLGYKKGDVHCFCTKQEHAKISPPSKIFCPPDWVENRRKHIVSKFDGFSKNILKITGKLSKETITLITAKIKENLEKHSDFNLQNINISSNKLTPNPYSVMKGTNRYFSKPPSKILPEPSSLKVSDINIFLEKNNSFCNKDNFADKSPVSKTDLFSIDTNGSLINTSATLCSTKQSINNKSMTNDRTSNAAEKEQNRSDEEKPQPKTEENEEKTVKIGSPDDYKKLLTPSNNNISLARNRNFLCKKDLSTTNKISLFVRPNPINNKFVRPFDRPSLVSYTSPQLNERHASVGAKNSHLKKRPSSVGNKSTNLSDRPESVGSKASHLVEKLATVGYYKASNIVKGLASVGSKASRLVKRSSSGDKKESSDERPKSVGDNSYSMSEKSCTDKNSYTSQRPMSGGSKYLCIRERSVTFGEASYVGNNVSTIERPFSAREKFLPNLRTGYKPSRLYAKSMSIRNNMADNGSPNKDKPMSSGDKIYEAFENSNENKILHVYKNDIVGDNNSASRYQKPLSSAEIPSSILSPCSKADPLLFNDKSVSFGENIYVNGKSLCYNVTPMSADKANQPLFSLLPELEKSAAQDKYDSFDDNSQAERDLCEIGEKPLSENKSNSKLNDRTSARTSMAHFHTRSLSISDNIMFFEEKPVSTDNKTSHFDVIQDVPQEKTIYVSRRPTLAYQRKKRDKTLVSKMNLVKSSLDIVKSLHPLINQTVNSTPSKNSLQVPSKRKFLLDRSTKKKSIQSNADYSTGYTVQLVKLKNYHKIEEGTKK